MTWEDIVPLAEIEMHSAKSNLLVGRYVLYKKKRKNGGERERKKERKVLGIIGGSTKIKKENSPGFFFLQEENQRISSNLHTAKLNFEEKLWKMWQKHGKLGTIKIKIYSFLMLRVPRQQVKYFTLRVKIEKQQWADILTQ